MAYETGWSSIVEFQSGQEVSNKFDNAFTKIDEAFIGLDETDTQLSLEIQALANLIQPFYIYSKAQAVTIEDTWTDLCEVSAVENDHATFEYKMALSFELDSAIHSAHFRYSIDGGINWDETIIEPSDATNKQGIAYFFPKDVLEDAGVSLKLQAMKSDAADVMTINFADVIIEKKIDLS